MYSVVFDAQYVQTVTLIHRTDIHKKSLNNRKPGRKYQNFLNIGLPNNIHVRRPTEKRR
jgi:hypothetical protein